MVATMKVIGRLPIVVTTMIVTVTIVLLTSGPLAQFIGRRPAIIILYLDFLLVVNLDLITRNFNFRVPGNCLCTTVNFSVVVRIFGRVTHHGFVHRRSALPLQTHATSTVLHLVNKGHRTGIRRSTSGPVPVPVPRNTFTRRRHCVVGNMLALTSHSLHKVVAPHNRVD